MTYDKVASYEMYILWSLPIYRDCMCIQPNFHPPTMQLQQVTTCLQSQMFASNL